MAAFCALVILGANIPLDVETTSNTELASGVTVPIPTCPNRLLVINIKNNKQGIKPFFCGGIFFMLNKLKISNN
jgi:hypothetical protein